MIKRSAKDTVDIRIVWQGSQTTTLHVPVNVGRFRFLSGADEMEDIIVAECKKGQSDEAIASLLSAKGFKSPKHSQVLARNTPSRGCTVRSIRYTHGILHSPHQSRPQRVRGYLTVPQIAKAIGTSLHWIYDRIHNGTITSPKKSPRGGIMFPDRPQTIKQFKALKSGKLKRLDS